MLRYLLKLLSESQIKVGTTLSLGPALESERLLKLVTFSSIANHLLATRAKLV
jgi:hypothetical protein